MRKLTRQLIALLVLVIAIGAFISPSAKVTAAASDCDLIADLCRLTSRVNYDICILQGNSPTSCAWKEAQDTIDCITNAGCTFKPVSRPGGN